jgi:ankyrin repeat protein
MTDLRFVFDISFLDSELQIPESYYGIILDKNDIGSMSEHREVLFPSNIRNAELTNITQIQVERAPDETPMVYDQKQKEALLNFISQNKTFVVKKIFEQLKSKPTYERFHVLVAVMEIVFEYPKLLSDEMLDIIFSQEELPVNDYLPNDKSPLENAIILKNMRIIKKLIEKGADVNQKHAYNDQYKDWTPLLFAIHFYPEAVPYLIANKADVQYKIKQTNAVAGKLVDVEVIAYSLPKLLEDNNVATLTELLKAKADVNARDAADATLLMRAAEAGNVAFMRTLVDNGADTGLVLPDYYIERYNAYDLFKRANPNMKPADSEVIGKLLRSRA